MTGKIRIGKPRRGGWIDITRPIGDSMEVYPGDPPTLVEPFADERASGGARVSAFSMSAHAGTHVDAPMHYLPGGASVEALPLDAMIGRAYIVEYETFMSGGTYYKRMLLRNAREMTAWPEGLPFPALLGVDAASVGSDAVHRLLLKNDVVLLEGLDLSCAPPGACELVCLPLKIPGSDGSPARAILWRDEG